MQKRTSILLFRPRKIGKNKEFMTNIFTNIDILWKMPFCILSAGGGIAHDMRKKPSLFLLLFKLNVLRYGLKKFDDTI